MEQEYSAYRNFLYQFFIVHVKNPAIAEDLAQDVFIKFWERRDQLKDIENMDAWLYTLARNHLTDHYRRLATEKKYQQSVWNHMERHSNRVLLEIYKKELQDEIDHLLDQLSPRQKEVYLLSRENGLSLDEIAVRLKISPNTAKNHLVHALKVVRTGLNQNYTPVLILISLLV